MKAGQLQLPLFPDGMFEKVKEAYRAQEFAKLQKELEHLKHRVAGFVGYRTKRKKRGK